MDLHAIFLLLLFADRIKRNETQVEIWSIKCFWYFTLLWYYVYIVLILCVLHIVFMYTSSSPFFSPIRLGFSFHTSSQSLFVNQNSILSCVFIVTQLLLFFPAVTNIIFAYPQPNAKRNIVVCELEKNISWNLA